MLDWSIQGYVNTMPKRKAMLLKQELTISLGNVIIKVISQQVHHSTVKKIINRWKTFRTAANCLPRRGFPSNVNQR